MFTKKRSELKEVLRETQNSRRAIGQFNFSTVEQLRAIIDAAQEIESPVICGTSSVEARYFGIEEAVFIRNKLTKGKSVSVFLNFDHGRDFDSIKKAIDSGYEMVHFDGSKLPIEENQKIATKIVHYAKKRGVVVEGEISQIGGKSSLSEDTIEETPLTSIDKIVKFIKETNVDCIALDVGNVHGIHKHMPRLHLERVNELLEGVSCFVSLHGGSGIVDQEIKDAIIRGVTKININTELRLAWRETLLKTLQENPYESIPYNILPIVQKAVFKKVVEKINLFNNS